MAEIKFTLGSQDFGFNPKKIERSKLYGATERVVLDDNNQTCKAVSMDESGTVIIPKGGTALGILDEDFNWIERNQLVAVNDDGEIIKKISSSFSNPINLDTRVSVETYLDHSVSSIYQLDGDYNELIKLIGADIYMFDFNYRESYDSSPAFLLNNEEGLFMVVGIKNDFEFVGLQEVALLDAEEEEEDSDEFDIDFSMM